MKHWRTSESFNAYSITLAAGADSNSTALRHKAGVTMQISSTPIMGIYLSACARQVALTIEKRDLPTLGAELEELPQKE